METTTTTSQPLTGVDKRLAELNIKPVKAVAIVGAMIVFVGDAQALALIPLISTMGGEGYDLSPSQASLVIAMLGLVGAGFLPVLTRLADRISLRKFLLLGIALVTVGNAISALAPGFTLLVLGRAIVGLGAAMPISHALAREKAPDEHSTNRALAVITAAVGLSVVFSFMLGGVILKVGGHVSTVFWVMSALGLLTLIVGYFIVPDYQVKARQNVDLRGAITLVIGLTLVAVGIAFTDAWGVRGVLILVAGFVVTALWVVAELKVEHPMIDLRLTFRRHTVPAYILGGLFAAVAVISNLAVTAYGEFDPVPFSDAPALAGPLGYGWGFIVLQTSMFLMPTALFIFIGGFALMALCHDYLWANAVGMGTWGVAYALGSTAANAVFLHAASDSEGAHSSAAAATVVATVGGLAAPVFTAILYSFAIEVSLPGSNGESVMTEIPTVSSYENVYWGLPVGGVIMLILTLLHKNQKFGGGTPSGIIPTVAPGQVEDI